MPISAMGQVGNPSSVDKLRMRERLAFQQNISRKKLRPAHSRGTRGASKEKEKEMAVYFPPLYCGQGTILKARKDFYIDYDDNNKLSIITGDKCMVIEIIGYGYNLKKYNSDKEFRIMNSLMSEYFEILDKVEPTQNLDKFGYKEHEGNLTTLKKDFEIKNVVKISAGQQFLHFVDKNPNTIFHDLFSVDNKEKVLRMKDIEFLEYFNE